MAKSANDLRQQASVEAEVAKARLVRAQEHADRAAAMLMATEAAFDAGMAKAYANSAKEDFLEPDQILFSVKSFLGEKGQRTTNPKTFSAAMGAAKQAEWTDCAFYMGHAYVYADTPQKAEEVLHLFDTTFRDQAVTPAPKAANPTQPVTRLKSKLLR